MNSVTLMFTLPDPILNPNKKVHWAKKSRAARKKKQAVRWDTIRQLREQGLPDNLRWKHVTATIKWFRNPKGPPLDRDNAQAMLKSTWDGMEEAGLLLNDRYLKVMPPDIDTDYAPRMYITLTLEN